MKTLALLLLLTFAAPVEAQCMDAFRCVIHTDTTQAMRRETWTSVYILGSFAVVGSNAIWGWDQDHGGYADTYLPSKQGLHFASAFVLTQGAIALDVKPWVAVTITSVAGVGFEFSQGHVNGHDIAADVLGSVAGALMAHWLRF